VDAADLDSSTETLTVRLTDEDGVTGVGEADAPAEAASSLVLINDAHAWTGNCERCWWARSLRARHCGRISTRDDDLVGHAKLASHCETRVSGAEMAATVYE
jgi:L-alanine-DL-glutamate epimerase-like enolase superfamily enzyme